MQMAVRKSTAVWKGSSREGSGTLRLGSGQFEGPYTWLSRFKEGPETNPEELIAAAHAGCFSMALASGLSKQGHVPTKISTSAEVLMDNNNVITGVALETVGEVPGIDEKTFVEFAEDAKKNCPVSKALAALEITLDARLA
jgi:osmotically inducible protein OsmC